MEVKIWPKIELHVHLDCSLSYDVVKQLSPGITPDDYRYDFIGPPKCHDLADYLTRANAALNLLQDADAMRIAVEGLFEQWKADNVIYGEVRFAPLLHIRNQLTPERVIEIVNETVSKCKKRTGIEAGIILCTLRHFSEKQGMETIKLVEQFAGTNVVGFDIASDEAGYPIDEHIRPFQYAMDKGISCTAHAGEAKGPESVWETLEHFHPKRIGHGVRSMEDPKLVQHLLQKDIHLEVCPTSNVQTNVYDTMFYHRATDIFEAGISMSLSTDARAISDVTLEDEYHTLKRIFNWGKSHFLACNLEGIRHAFASVEVKEKIRERLEKEYSK